MYLQEVIARLQSYWERQGCIIAQPYDMEVGAGTFHPFTFLRVLGSRPWRAVYVQPSRRPTDGRYGENPHRLRRHYQIQVIIKPPPDDIQALYILSLKDLGIRIEKHDIRFVEDDWESPTLGAWGLGWEVWLDGIEITQFTYFQQAGGIDLDPISVELTYGLERICCYIQNKKSVMDIEWAKGVCYKDLHFERERQFSVYNFEKADLQVPRDMFSMCEKEAAKILDEGTVLPAYDYVLKCSHAFNILDARGALSVTERTAYIARVRALAHRCAALYIKSGEGIEVEKEKKDKK